MTSAGHICSECPDGTRIERRCPYPVRDPRRTQEHERALASGVASCRVLDVPGWYHDMAELGGMMADGAVSPADVDARTWELARHCIASVRDGRAAAEDGKKRRREIIAAALERRG